MWSTSSSRPARLPRVSEQWVDRLQAYREHLEEELKNVQELNERLGQATPTTETV